ncbi:MAG: hypothetical protein AVDCRST_MAG27-2834, partial [uncultured Craurococcus sp.]
GDHHRRQTTGGQAGRPGGAAVPASHAVGCDSRGTRARHGHRRGGAGRGAGSPTRQQGCPGDRFLARDRRGYRQAPGPGWLPGDGELRREPRPRGGRGPRDRGGRRAGHLAAGRRQRPGGGPAA